jgi:hypothetical protein
MSNEKVINEKDILLNMYQTTYEFLIHLYEARINITNIKREINELDNNYFEEDKDNICLQMLDIFDENSMDNLIQILSIYKNRVEDKLNNTCVHEWVYDDIDIGPESSQRICYCKLCEISKK